MSSDILIVDDEADIRELVAGILDDEGYRTRTARSSDDALAQIEQRRPHLIFLDIWLQGSRLDGLQLLESIKELHPEIPIVMISATATSKPPSPRSRRALTTSSRSPSRRIASCWLPSARSRRRR